MQNFALVDAQEEYEEHNMADKVVVQNGKYSKYLSFILESVGVQKKSHGHNFDL